MATIAGEPPYEERSVFVRKATGLVRGWSLHDAFIYATFSINLITLGLYIFASGPFIPKGSLLLAIILSGASLCFQTVVYSALIAVMPRAGGDYVWVSRVIGGGLGFTLAVCGWWFINWHWVPIYANILTKEFFQPLGAILGWNGFVSFWGEPRGIFVSSVITAILAAFFISLGMRGYARLQKLCFYAGITGLLIIFGLLIFHSKTEFQTAFNHYAVKTYHSTSTNAYNATVKSGTYHGARSLGGLAFGSTLLRVISATAFDGILPEWAARVDKRGTPYFAILIMLGPSLIIAYFYAYNSNFTSWTLDATLVIAVTFVGSTVAAGILPYRKPEIYNASPIAKYKVAGIPLITSAAVLFLAFLGFCIYKWLQDGVYGSNNHGSLIYMGCLYGVALAIYVGSRIVRKRQGLDMSMVYGEIPVE